MKNLYLLLAIALLVAGCKKKEALVPVRVIVDDFTITQEDFPSREDPTGIGDYSGVKANPILERRRLEDSKGIPTILF